MFKTASILILFAILAGTLIGTKRSASRAWLLLVAAPVSAALFLLLCSVLVLLWEVMP